MSKVRLYGGTSGFVELAAPDVSDDGVLTLPTAANGFGKIVAVKDALFTGTQSGSVAAGGLLAVTGLTITHQLSEPTNRLIISAYIGVTGTSDTRGAVGLVVQEDGTSIAVGPSNRQVTAGGARQDETGSPRIGQSIAATFVYAPGDTLSHTYTVSVMNIEGATETLYVNRPESTAGSTPTTSSALVIQEVAA